MWARLEEYFSYYNLVDEDIIYLQVSFRLLDRMIYSDIVLDKDIGGLFFKIMRQDRWKD